MCVYICMYVCVYIYAVSEHIFSVIWPYRVRTLPWTQSGGTPILDTGGYHDLQLVHWEDHCIPPPLIHFVVQGASFLPLPYPQKLRRNSSLFSSLG
jgi:hypothetical protein